MILKHREIIGNFNTYIILIVFLNYSPKCYILEKSLRTDAHSAAQNLLKTKFKGQDTINVNLSPSVIFATSANVI